MILAGLAESQLDITFLFGEYLLLHFPVLGLIKALLIVTTIVWLYPDHPVINTEKNTANARPILKEERTLAITLVVLLTLWLTDFVHHISPAWIALGGAIFLLLPRIGVVSSEVFNTKINYTSIFFIAGVIGLGSMIKHSGLGDSVGDYLISTLPLSPETPFINYMSVSLASTLIGLLTTLPGVPAIMTPFSSEIAEVTGLSIKSILMMQVLGFSTMLLPYQAPPLVVAMHLSGERIRRIIKPLLLIALVIYIVFFPINYMWWRFIEWV
jgi:di/tricarboxylate transporter